MNMKTNLHKLYGSDKSCEKDGVVFDCGEGMTFTLARFGGHNDARIAEKTAKKHKPYITAIQRGDLKPEIADKLRVEVFCEVCVKGWSGLKDDKGEDIPYTHAKAIELLLDMPDLFNALFGFANNFDNYKLEVGNSSSLT